jgi:DNA-binding IclR family transcriptional regulator
MTELQTAVLKAMAGARALNCGEISIAINRPSQDVWRVLADLETAGYVQRLANSPDRVTHWVRTDLLEGLV